MIWSYFAAFGPGQIAIVESKINSQVYKGIQNNVGLSYVMQEDKHQQSKSITEWLRTNVLLFLECPSQNPHFST